jgi:hypothetical protein
MRFPHMLILYSSQFIRESRLLSDITASKKLRRSDLYQYIGREHLSMH